MTSLLLADVLTQVAAAPTVSLDLGKLVLATIGTVLSILATAVIFFVKRLIASFDGFKGEVRGKMGAMQKNLSDHSEDVGGQLQQIGSQVQKVTQEMFGPNGENGMRGDLKELKAEARKTREMMVERDLVLVLLADKAGVPFKKEG